MAVMLMTPETVVFPGLVMLITGCVMVLVVETFTDALPVRPVESVATAVRTCWPLRTPLLSHWVEKEGPAPLNRYYEAFPPKLVQSTIATLQAFYVSGDNPDEVADELQRQADIEWPAWEENPAIG